MHHKRELWWWLAACAAGVGVSALVGGLIGPMVALFVVVLLAGAVLIEYEGPRALPADEDAVPAAAVPALEEDGPAAEPEPEPAPEPEPEPEPEATAEPAIEDTLSTEGDAEGTAESTSSRDAEQKTSAPA